MRPQPDLRAVAAQQHGNVTRDQLLLAGFTHRAIRTAIGNRWLIRRHRGVYAVGHVPRARASRWAAAVLAFGDGTVLGHRAATAHWEVLRGPVPTEVIVPTRAGRQRRDGIIVHRIVLPPEHVTVRDGIPVTTLLRTVLDAATVLRGGRLAGVFEEAQVRYGLAPDLIAAEAICRRGYRGNARIWALLQGAVDPANVLSVLELRFLRMCAAHNIPRPLVNEKIGPWTPDFLWPDARLVVETDGSRFHGTLAARERDARKDAFMVARGLTVVRLSWADVTERPDLVAATVRHQLWLDGRVVVA